MAAGLVAKPWAESRHGDVAGTILDVAADVDACVIVMGSRGLHGVKAFLLGSVSHAVMLHADRAVLVVPSGAPAERRGRRIDRALTPA
jgi:nucleotide-binding universal stress UspA family protein